MTCPAVGQLGPDDFLVCDLDSPHPGILHHDPGGRWWGETDDGGVMLAPQDS
jgi:hypothetical protein